jgi:hypothetical protein
MTRVKNLFHGYNYTKRHPGIYISQHEITMSLVFCLCAYWRRIEVGIHLDYKYDINVSFRGYSESVDTMFGGASWDVGCIVYGRPLVFHEGLAHWRWLTLGF